MKKLKIPYAAIWCYFEIVHNICVDKKLDSSKLKVFGAYYHQFLNNMEISTTKLTNALGQIHEWSLKLPDWESDALRRLLMQREISEHGIDEIMDLLKVDLGMVDKSALKNQPKRLSLADIPVQGEQKKKIIIESLQGLTNVNALVPGGVIKFERNGLTIIFGYNASGKSGYARVLKKACRARGNNEPILPNVFSKSPIIGPAKALINIYESESKKTIQWEDGKDSYNDLNLISVFDSDCARVYVDEANDVAYIPYGLDVFNGLCKICDQIRAKFKSEIVPIPDVKEQFADLLGDTSVGILVQDLSKDTKFEQVERLVKLSDDERKRLLSLEKKLAELKINDPKIKAEDIRKQKRRFAKILDNMKTLNGLLNADQLSEVKTLFNNLEIARRAAKVASEISFKDEPLQGIGGDVWKILYGAARDFSVKVAYPGKEFPVIDEKARCVLCLQELSKEGSDRMKRFDDFVKDKTEKVAEDALTKYKKKMAEILNVNSVVINVDEDVFKEIEQIDPTVAKECKDFLNSEIDIIDQMKSAYGEGKLAEIETHPDLPDAGISRILDGLEKKAGEFDKISNKKEKESAESEFKELNARSLLSEKKDMIIDRIKNLRKNKSLNDGIRAVDTTHISRKNTELMQSLITDQLKENLKDEFKALGVGSMNINLDKVGRSGLTLHKFKLDSASHPSISLSAVLSEGEQRAIAIASFLAELNTSESSSGIIFDDPVSSLDHIRRKKVASRLVEEARKRQVVVFTHEIVFLTELQHALEGQEIPYLVQTVYEDDLGPGHCIEEAPWAGLTAKKRIGKLKVELEEIKKIRLDRKSLRVRQHDFLVHLRKTWERVVEEVVFGDAIKRFRDSIETQRLKDVRFGDADYKIINKGMTKISSYLHDIAAERNDDQLPKIEDLESCVNELEGYVNSVRGRQ